MLSDLALWGAWALIAALPFALSVAVVKNFSRRGRRAREAADEVGRVFENQLPQILGLLIAALAAFLLGTVALPTLVWVVDADPEGRRVALSLLGVVAFLFAVAYLCARPGLKLWIATDDALVLRRGSRDRVIAWRHITAVTPNRRSWGGVVLETHAGRVRVPSQLAGHDEFLTIVAARSGAAVPGMGGVPGTGGGPGTGGAIEGSTVAVEPRRTRLIIGFFALLLAFFWIWPWFGVSGEHPTRDAFIFVGIGTGLWAMIFGLVYDESFRRSEPSMLRLTDLGFAHRTFGRSAVEVERRDVVAVSVETDIRYVKGMPGRMYPLVVTLTDGRAIRLGQHRARHMGTTTHELLAWLRPWLIDPSRSTHTDADDAGRLLVAADAAEAEGRLGDAASAIETAIARHPSPAQCARYGHAGDLWRRADNHGRAVSLYRAGIDANPDDADLWQGLAASLSAQGHRELAQEAAYQAEQLLLDSRERH